MRRKEVEEYREKGSIHHTHSQRDLNRFYLPISLSLIFVSYPIRVRSG